MHRYRRWPIHLALVGASVVMLIPFYWVLKTSVTGENIFSYPPSILPKSPHPFYYVDVWYYIPFARYFLNSIIVSALTLLASSEATAWTQRQVQSIPAHHGIRVALVTASYLSVFAILFVARFAQFLIGPYHFRECFPTERLQNGVKRFSCCAKARQFHLAPEC